MEKFARKCDCCGKGMNKGYLDVGEYYCSDECLIGGNEKQGRGYSMEDWAVDHAENPDECYWTEWEELDDDYYYDEQGNEYQSCVICDNFVDVNKESCEDCRDNPEYKRLFNEWFMSDNVHERNGVYSTQCHQYQNRIKGMVELYKFYLREHIQK